MLSPNDVKVVLEAALLASPEPLGIAELRKLFDEDVGAENKDPGWYKHPPDTVADLARKEDMDRDGIQV